VIRRSAKLNHRSREDKAREGKKRAEDRIVAVQHMINGDFWSLKCRPLNGAGVLIKEGRGPFQPGPQSERKPLKRLSHGGYLREM